jgi:hypothetical protein
MVRKNLAFLYEPIGLAIVVFALVATVLAMPLMQGVWGPNVTAGSKNLHVIQDRPIAPNLLATHNNG